MDPFNVRVVAGIYVCGVDDDQRPVITCGFIEDEEHQLFLPSMSVTHKHHAAEIAIRLFREHVATDLRTLDIVPFGFFDPIREPTDERRTIYLGYKTRIHPGTPVHSDLRFMKYEEVSLARRRISASHYQAYRTGLG